ncbi:Hypothetical protein YqcC [Klebsiella pneumoniae subsp. pneumoniae 1084]|nr:Hypothetical protein YqcC [Klebsiella pneumoniae subsp. pneumoniae 1084]
MKAGCTCLWMNMVRRPQEKFSRTSREHQCSGTAAKRTGSTVYTVLPFLISPADLLSCARFLTHRGFPMTLHDSVRDRLRAIEALLRETEHWQETAPDSSAFASDKPFCLDTLEPLEWLQWVLIPRMHQLLESGQPLPQNFAVAPYYEMALDQAHPVRESMLAELLLLDALFAGEQA